MGSHYWVCIRTRRVHFLWIIHGSPVEGRLNWDVVLLSRVLGGSRALGQKFFVVPNIGAGTREMRAMMVWGLSLCLATAWVRGISLFGVREVPVVFAGLEGGGLKCTRGGARGDRPLSGRRCRFTVSLPYCVYCYLPGFGLWGIVAAQYIWTLRRRLYHLTCLSALDLVVWGMLDSATRGRCLIVLWGRERCQRTGYTAVVVAVGCMPGCGLGGIWICTLYFERRYTW